MHLTSPDSSLRTLLMPSCLSVGCYNEKATAQVEQTLFCQFRNLGRPGSRCWQIPVVEGPLPCVQMAAFSFCPHVAVKRSKLSPLSSRKDTNPISEPSSFQPCALMQGSSLVLEDRVPLFVLFPKAERTSSSSVCCSFCHTWRPALTRKPPQPIPAAHLGALGTSSLAALCRAP